MKNVDYRNNKQTPLLSLGAYIFLVLIGALSFLAALAINSAVVAVINENSNLLERAHGKVLYAIGVVVILIILAVIAGLLYPNYTRKIEERI